MNIDELSNSLVFWLQDYAKNAGLKGAVFGMSGGIDSAVVSVLCKKAFGDNCLGLIMPCYSNKDDEVDAMLVAEKFKINCKKIVLDRVYDAFLSVVENSKDPVTLANIKPRLRMMVLYYYAGINNYLVVGSGNKSELTVGYFTKYGDGGVDISPLGNLVKTQVRQLAAHLGIPKKIIEKPPTAGLWSGQTDEQEMGISYDELDRYILTGKTLDPDAMDKIMNMHKNSEHKRKTPPIPSFNLK